MSAAQVTEAHRGLAQNIVFYHTPKGSSTAQGVRDAAQLIANSEARATYQLRQQVANLTHSNDSHRETAETWRAAAIERDQLRAEVRAVLKIVNEQTARAERAELRIKQLEELK